MFIDPWLRDAYQQSIRLGGRWWVRRYYFVSGLITDEDAVLPNDNEPESVFAATSLLATLDAAPDLETRRTPRTTSRHGC